MAIMALRAGLHEGKLRIGERGGDSGLIEEGQAVCGAQDSFARQNKGDTQTRPEVFPMELAGRAGKTVLPKVVELLRLQIEDGALVVRFRGRKIQGVTKAEIHGDAAGGFPIVLHEPLLKPGARLKNFLLNVDGELLYLAQQEASERGACAGDARKICKQSAEGEGARGGGRLTHVEAGDAVVDAELQGMPAAQK